MVQVTLRYADSDDTFMLNLPLTSLVSALIAQVVELHNLRQRIRALCDLMKRHTPNRDADLVAKMLSEANACIGKEQVAANVEATPQLYTACCNSMKSLITSLFNEAVSAEATRIVNGEENVAGQHNIDSVSLWWAKKELQAAEPLSTYAGKHDRTKLFVTLSPRSASGIGAPALVRAPTVDPHKEQYLNARAAAELAPAAAEDDEDTRNAPWAQSNLKSMIRGTANLGYRVEEY